MTFICGVLLRRQVIYEVLFVTFFEFMGQIVLQLNYILYIRKVLDLCYEIAVIKGAARWKFSKFVQRG